MVHQSVNACLFPILAADGMHITTVEGIGSWKAGAQSSDQDNLHPIQRAMVDMHGSQCGFCTPGIIMAIYGLFASNTEGRLNIKHLEEHLDGNLCRCTGYRPIWDAARSLCDDEEGGASGPCGVKCRECPERESCEMDCNVEEKKQEGGCRGGLCGGVVHSCTESKVMEFKQVVDETYGEWWKRPDESFPNELTSAQNEPLLVVDTSVHSGGTWFQPHTLEELLDLFREFAPQEGGLKLVVGNTEVGIETKFKHAVFPRLVRPMESVHTLYEVVETDTHFYVGACSSLSSLQSFCHKRMADKKSMKVAAPIHDMLRWFASTQIRNVACLGGNLATASPISDMNPMLAAMGATIVLASRPRSDGGIDRRTIPVKDFFLGYRTVDKKEIEVIERVEIPLAGKFEYIAPFKQARRREDDISIVTSGMKMKLRPEGSSWIIDDISIAFGGMAPKTVMASKTMEALAGKKFEDSSFTEARAVMQNEFRMPEDVPGGQAEYRLTLACSFLHKFYLHCVNELKKEVESSDVGSLPPVPVIDNEEESAVAGFLSAQKPSIGGTQSFPEPKVATGLEESHFAGDNDKVPKVSEAAKESTKMDSVGRPATHASGPLHCTGEASYTDDIPAPENLLHGSLILASKCHASLESIDITHALKIPGVFGVYTHQDIEKLGGDNRMGPILLDDVTFLPIGEKVDFVGQVLGIVVGLCQEIAEKGARAVNVQYSEEFEGNPIVSIEDAIKAESFWTDFRHEMKRGGDVNKILSQTEVDGKELVVVEGSIRSGGQEHFCEYACLFGDCTLLISLIPVAFIAPNTSDLEPNSTLAIPSESGTNLTIYASTQAPTKTQDFCARVTNTPAGKLVCDSRAKFFSLAI
jgi:xanthine dehydrogenase/oxidase